MASIDFARFCLATRGGVASFTQAFIQQGYDLQRFLTEPNPEWDLCLCRQGPGSVVTPIWDKAEEEAAVRSYKGTPYADALVKTCNFYLKEGRSGYPPERIGRYLVDATSASLGFPILESQHTT